MVARIKVVVEWPEYTEDEIEQYLDEARQYFENQLHAELLDEHSGRLVAIDGRSKKYVVESATERFVHHRLLELAPDAVVFTARVGSEWEYMAGGARG